MNEYALIKNGKVKNVIVADEAFVAKISARYDEVIRVDELVEKPGVAWKKSGDDFVRPAKRQESEGKKQLKGARQAINDAESVEDLKPILKKMLRLIMENSK